MAARWPFITLSIEDRDLNQEITLFASTWSSCAIWGREKGHKHQKFVADVMAKGGRHHDHIPLSSRIRNGRILLIKGTWQAERESMIVGWTGRVLTQENIDARRLSGKVTS